MKNTIITTALVAILGLAFIGAPVTVQAQTTNTATSTAPVKAKKASKIQYKGSITAIDASSLTVANSTKTLTLAIAPTTKFLKDKKPATAADFAVGDAVTGSYTADAAGTLTAASVHKKTSAASKPAAATPAATPAPTTAPATQ